MTHLPLDDEALCRGVIAEAGLGFPLEKFDAFAAKIADEAHMPYGLVNLLTGDRQFFIGLHNPTSLPPFPRIIPRTDGGRNVGYCGEVIARGKPYPLRNVFLDPRLKVNPVVSSMGVKSYYGAPLVELAATRAAIAICVISTEPLSREEGRRVDGVVKAGRDELTDQLNRVAVVLPHSAARGDDALAQAPQDDNGRNAADHAPTGRQGGPACFHP